MEFRKLLLSSALLLSGLTATAIDHPGITSGELSPSRFILIENGRPSQILIGDDENTGVRIASDNLLEDFGRVCGNKAGYAKEEKGNRLIIIATQGSRMFDRLVKSGAINREDLKGKNEKYVITTASNPLPGVDEALVIAGSDRRGTIYGIYEISEQIGVSPWYDWADVPVAHKENLAMDRGSFTAGEPAVKYRGIFLNDEAPCLTGWVKNTYGTNYGNHEFYARVNELILRLRGNFLWPAMWMWSFYADDPLNSKTADEMGVIMGTSHHEPMARNHQEWARHRNEYGSWNYQTNQAVIDDFFRKGIQRSKNTEDVVTIGMRGDGDEAMSEDADVALLKKIIDNQRKIIKKESGKPADKTPQVWALYKEVLDYYDKGLRAPSDVIYLLCDDNWGNVRRLPNAEERKHPGGWGMYYHVDYVGAPRNSKLLNVTPVQNMWEQLTMTYDYGVDKLWILNVGDLKPMEYPITMFLDMAWNPHKYEAGNITDHTRQFFRQQFGEKQGDEAARILNLYTKYAGRVTPEMLERNTYDLESGEWKRVADDFARLETEALRQYLTLEPEYRDAYKQLVLFPVQLFGNLYEMYYAQAMNHALAAEGYPEANEWAKKVKKCFARDGELMKDYNENIAGGKWRGMMTQKHIGYTIWNDDFPADICPEVKTVDADRKGGFVAKARNGEVLIEAENYYDCTPGNCKEWTVIPDMGPGLSAVTVMPRDITPEGAKITYKIKNLQSKDSVDVSVEIRTTLAFANKDGHRYKIGIKGGGSEIVNFNSDLNEAPENIYNKFYPTVARRSMKMLSKLEAPAQNKDGEIELYIEPLDPGVIVERISVK